MPRLPSFLGRVCALPLATLVACTARPPTPAGPPPVRIPPGCERSLAGEYHHASHPAFRYLAEDDGSTLTLTVVRARPDGGAASAPEAGASTIVLSRTPEGFIGETRGTGFNVAGNPCPVSFPTQLTACADEQLTLRTVASTALDEACLPPPSPPPPKWVEQVLRRGAPDAGS